MKKQDEGKVKNGRKNGLRKKKKWVKTGYPQTLECFQWRLVNHVHATEVRQVSHRLCGHDLKKKEREN